MAWDFETDPEFAMGWLMVAATSPTAAEFCSLTRAMLSLSNKDSTMSELTAGATVIVMTSPASTSTMPYQVIFELLPGLGPVWHEYR